MFYYPYSIYCTCLRNIKKGAPYVSRGCWKDDIPRAITDIDADIPSANGHYKRRQHPEQNCLDAAKARGYKIFALQDGGQCFGSDNLNSYKTYGGSTACSDGKGGPMANDVYEIRAGMLLIKFFEH